MPSGCGYTGCRCIEDRHEPRPCELLSLQGLTIFIVFYNIFCVAGTIFIFFTKCSQNVKKQHHWNIFEKKKKQKKVSQIIKILLMVRENAGKLLKKKVRKFSRKMENFRKLSRKIKKFENCQKN